VEREARHAWFAEAATVAHAEGVRGDSSQPFRLRRVARTNQGLRSFHSLNPCYSPCTPYRGADSRLDATSLAIGSIGLVGFHGVLALEFVLGIQERSHS